MPSVSIPTAVIGAGAGIASGIMGANAAKDAAKTQAQAAAQAQQSQLAMYQQSRADETPFMSVGTSALGQLASLFGLAAPQVSPQSTVNGGSALAPGGMTDQQAQALLQSRPDVMQAYATAKASADPNSPAFSAAGLDSPLNYARHWYNNMGGSTSYTIPTTGGTAQPATSPLAGATSGLPAGANGSALSAQLMATPGYQFGMDQGVKALDRSAAARGLTLSGGQMQDISSFGNNYALQQAWTPYVSELNSMASLGQNAASGVGNNGLATGQGVATSQLAQGQASASGTIGAANSYQSALQSALQGYQMSQQPYGSTYGIGNNLTPYDPIGTMSVDPATNYGGATYGFTPTPTL